MSYCVIKNTSIVIDQQEDQELMQKNAENAGISKFEIITDEEYITRKLQNPDPSIEISKLKVKLSQTDYAVIKIAEGAAAVEEYADIITQRQAWREEINQLENNVD